MVERKADTDPGRESRDPVDDTRDSNHSNQSTLLTRLARRAVRFAPWVAIAAPVLFGLLLLALQSDWVTRKALSAGAEAAVGPGARLSVADIGGNRLTSLRVAGVRLEGAGDSLLFEADSLRVRYFPLSLLWGKLSLRELRVVAPNLEIRRPAPDTSRGRAPEEDDEDEGGGLAVAIGQLDIRRGNLTLVGPPSSPPDTLQVRDLHLQIDGLRLGDRLAFRLDTLGLSFHTSSHTAGWAELTARGELSRDVLVVERLALRSPYSSVEGFGTLPLPPPGAPLSGIDTEVADFELQASPLGFRDLRPVLGGVDPDAAAEIDLTVRGGEGALEASLRADLSDGSNVRFQGSWRGGGNSEGGYRLEGRVQDLDPGLWTAAGRSLGSLNAELDADLRGSKLSTASGPASLVLEDSRYGDLTVSRAEVVARLDQGRVDLQLDADLSTGNVGASGWIRPFDSEVAYDLRGESTLNAYGLPGGAIVTEWIGGSKAEWSLAGRGTDPASARAEARLEVRRPNGGAGRLESGRLEVRLADGEGGVSADLALPGGPVSLEGNFSVGEPVEYELERLEFEGLNLAAVLGDSTSSRLTGTLSGSGRGTDLARAELQARLRLADADYAGYVVDTLDISARLRAGQLELEGSAGIGPGSIQLAGMATPFAEVAEYRVRRLRLSSLDIGRLTGLDVETDITGDGRLSFRAARAGLADTRFQARLDLKPSRVNAQRITGGLVDLEVEAGELDGQVELEGPEGSLSFAVAGRPFADRPTYSIAEGAFRHIDLGALLGRDRPEGDRPASDLNGRFELRAAGRSLDDATLAARLVMDTSRIDTLTLTGGRLVSEADSGRFELEASLSVGGGDGELHVDGELLPRPDSARTPSLRARLWSRAEFAGAVLDTLSAEIRMSSGALEVDTLLARSNVVNADAGGRIAWRVGPSAGTTEFRSRVELVSLQPLATLLGVDEPAVGSGLVEIDATGAVDSLELRLEGQASNLDLGSLRVSQVTASARARLDERRRLASATGSARITRMLLGPAPVADTRIEASYGDSEIRVELESRDERRDLRLTAVVDPRPESRRARIEEFDLRLDRRHWVLEEEAIVRYGDPLMIEGFELRSGTRSFTAGGVLSRRDSSDFRLAVDSLRLGAIADAVGIKRVDGSLSLSAQLTGPARAPRVDGRLAASIDSPEGRVASLRADAAWAGGALDLEAAVAHPSGKRLRLEGRLPFRLDLAAAPDTVSEDDLVVYSDQNIDLSVSADGFPVGVVRPLLDPGFATDIRGSLDADIRLRGTARSPEATGSLRLSRAGVRLPGLGVSYDPVDIALDLDGDRIRIERASVRSGQGSLQASGEIDIRQLALGGFDIAAEFHRFEAIASTDYRADVSGRLTLNGTTQDPQLGGRITIDEASIYLSASDLPASVEPVELTEEDYQMLQEYWGYGIERRRPPFIRAFYEAAAIDLRLVITRNTWVRHRRSPQVAVELSGELGIKKDPNGQLLLSGAISPVAGRSYVEQFGRRFRITEGQVAFRGEPGSMTYRLVAEYSVPATDSRNTGEIVITLEIRGDPQNLSLTLGSRPPLEEADIVSYLATGSPASGGLGLSGESAAEAALAPVALGLEELASREIGLDVVEIRQDGFRGATLVAGRYVTPQLYLGFKQPVSFSNGSTDAPGVANQTEFVLEYEIYRWLLLNFEGGAAQGRFLLRAQHEY